MGARGKKRRRADGSVASGKEVNIQAKDLDDYPIHPVPAQALFENLSESLLFEAMTDAEINDWLDSDSSEGRPESDRIAERYDINRGSLEDRTDKLTLLLAKRDGLHRMEDGKLVWIEPALLDHAASVEMTWNSELRWPV